MVRENLLVMKIVSDSGNVSRTTKFIEVCENINWQEDMKKQLQNGQKNGMHPLCQNILVLHVREEET